MASPWPKHSLHKNNRLARALNVAKLGPTADLNTPDNGHGEISEVPDMRK